MLGIYEKRYFKSEEKVWIGRYRNLTNVLHWHFECELIRVVEGTAQIKIGENLFAAVADDCFFCGPEELHYIMGTPGSRIDVMIFEESLAREITQNYGLMSPKLTDSNRVKAGFGTIDRLLAEKPAFYRQAVANCAEGILIDIFNSHDTEKKAPRERTYQHMIDRINEDFAYMTFQEAVRHSGYSPSHFSKMFKAYSGMNFSDYLNIIKVEHAVSLIQSGEKLSMTEISSQCGFSTVRNFNRVFRQYTGYSPSTLPERFVMNSGIHFSKVGQFDPTDKNARLVEA